MSKAKLCPGNSSYVFFRFWAPVLSRPTMTLSGKAASVQLTDRSRRELWPIKLWYPPPITEHWESVPHHPRMLTLNSLYCWGRRNGSHKNAWDINKFQAGSSGPRNSSVSSTKSCLPTGNHNGHIGCVRTPISQSAAWQLSNPSQEVFLNRYKFPSRPGWSWKSRHISKGSLWRVLIWILNLKTPNLEQLNVNLW